MKHIEVATERSAQGVSRLEKLFSLRLGEFFPVAGIFRESVLEPVEGFEGFLGEQEVSPALHLPELEFFLGFFMVFGGRCVLADILRYREEILVGIESFVVEFFREAVVEFFLFLGQCVLEVGFRFVISDDGSDSGSEHGRAERDEKIGERRHGNEVNGFCCFS